jgi:hypothetical protein
MLKPLRNKSNFFVRESLAAQRLLISKIKLCYFLKLVYFFNYANKENGKIYIIKK